MGSDRKNPVLCLDRNNDVVHMPGWVLVNDGLGSIGFKVFVQQKPVKEGWSHRPLIFTSSAVICAPSQGLEQGGVSIISPFTRNRVEEIRGGQ